jgi:hypothetical protein
MTAPDYWNEIPFAPLKARQVRLWEVAIQECWLITRRTEIRFRPATATTAHIFDDFSPS